MNNNNLQKPKVRVIGAGPSGLMSVRHLSEISVDLKCYEANNQFGGNWSDIDTENMFFDEMYKKNYGTTYQSVYEDLQTNDPKLLLLLKGFPPKKEQKTYWSYQEYQNYLKGYAEHFGLKRFIQFNTIVEHVFWIPQMTQDDKYKYNITSLNRERFLIQLRVKVSEDNSTQIVYDLADYVFVCNGRFTVPYYPPFERSQEYDGTLLHSHSFRKRLLPDLAKKKILVIGVFTSGFDVLQFLMKNNKTPPKEIHLAIRNKMFYDGFLKTSFFREEIEKGQFFLHHKSIKATGKNKTIFFDDGSCLEDISEVIFCTGYQMSYPFLDKNLIEYLGTDKKAIGPLFKRVFCINEPHLVFIGLQSQFSTYYEKATMVATAYIQGKITLPDKDSMMKDFEQDINDMKKDDPTLMNYLYNFGYLDDSFYKYDADLAKMLNLKPEDLDLKQSQYVKNYINAAVVKLLTGDFPQLRQATYEDFQIPFNQEEIYCNTKF